MPPGPGTTAVGLSSEESELDELLLDELDELEEELSEDEELSSSATVVLPPVTLATPPVLAAGALPSELELLESELDELDELLELEELSDEDESAFLAAGLATGPAGVWMTGAATPVLAATMAAVLSAESLLLELLELELELELDESLSSDEDDSFS